MQENVDISKCWVAYLPWFAAGGVSLVVGTASVMQYLYNSIDKRNQVFQELLQAQLTEAKGKLQECRDELLAFKAKPIPPLGASVVTSPPRRSWGRWIAATGLIGVTIVLATIPVSKQFVSELGRYTGQSDQIKTLQTEVTKLSQPFDPDVLVSIFDLPVETRDHGSRLDGHTYDLDTIKRRKFQYSGTQPAILTGTSINALSVENTSGKKIRILVTPAIR
jgi:hypothetical protein